MRPTLDEYLMNIANAVATRATCDRAHVGAVLVRDKQILSTGYNGSPSGLPSCDDIGHLMEDGHCIRTVHAEMNAVVQCAIHGVSTKESTLYCTHLPCVRCAQVLINAGVIRIVYGRLYGATSGIFNLFEQANVRCIHA